MELPDSVGSAPDDLQDRIEECCESDVKCTGNTNINQNYICPEPMKPKANSNEIYGTTKEECCRFPDEKTYFEVNNASN